jgi:3-methyladenine DNA glycosylase Tag
MQQAPLDFTTIEEAALIRHGTAGLGERLPRVKSEAELAAMPDDRYLSAMSLRIFRAGLRHAAVDAKWPAFEEVFGGFDPERCAAMPDETIEALLGDKRLIRSLPKLRAVRANAHAMTEIAAERGSFGAWLAAWPVTDITGLWSALAKRFQQMGGKSAPAFLRMVGKDTFMPSEHVIRALGHWRLLEPGLPTRALNRRLEELFVGWHRATGKPLAALSQTVAASTD